MYVALSAKTDFKPGAVNRDSISIASLLPRPFGTTLARLPAPRSPGVTSTPYPSRCLLTHMKNSVVHALLGVSAVGEGRVVAPNPQTQLGAGSVGSVLQGLEAGDGSSPEHCHMPLPLMARGRGKGQSAGAGWWWGAGVPQGVSFTLIHLQLVGGLNGSKQAPSDPHPKSPAFCFHPRVSLQ